MNGKPLHDSPSIDDMRRTAADEDAFFNELASGSDYLVDRRFERWLKLRAFGRKAKLYLQRLPFGSGEALAIAVRRTWSAMLTRLEKGGVPRSFRRKQDRQDRRANSER
jgi:hypothetical protein